MNEITELKSRVNKYLSFPDHASVSPPDMLLEECLDIIDRLNEENISLKETLDTACKDYNFDPCLSPKLFK